MSSSSRSSNPPPSSSALARSRIATSRRWTRSCRHSAFEPAADDFGEQRLREVAVGFVGIQAEVVAEEVVELDEILDRVDELQVEHLVVERLHARLQRGRIAARR